MIIDDEETKKVADLMRGTGLGSRCRSRLKEAAKYGKTWAAYRKHAQEVHHEAGCLEIDDDAEVSMVEDRPEGAYVMAWLWVPREDLKGRNRKRPKQ